MGKMMKPIIVVPNEKLRRGRGKPKRSAWKNLLIASGTLGLASICGFLLLQTGARTADAPSLKPGSAAQRSRGPRALDTPQTNASPPNVSPPAPEVALDSAPDPAREPAEPPASKAPFRETICTAEGCIGKKEAAEKTQRLLAQNPTRFSAEEQTILKAYTLDGLGQAVSDAEYRFLNATDETRDSDAEHYRMVVNLVSAVSVDTNHALPAQEELAYGQYAAALRSAEGKLAKLDPVEAEHERERIKDRIFMAAKQ